MKQVTQTTMLNFIDLLNYYCLLKRNAIGQITTQYIIKRKNTATDRDSLKKTLLQRLHKVGIHFVQIYCVPKQRC